jgi:hypothetical protein
MKRLFFTSLMLLFFIVTNSYAAKWRVNNTAGIDADFTTFKEAHDAAAPGDTLMMEGSNAADGANDTIYKKLVVIGPGYFLNENEVTNDNILPAKLGFLGLAPGADGSVVMGISMENLGVDASNVIIERNYVTYTITFNYENGTQNVVVSKNYVNEIKSRYSAYENLKVQGLIISNNIIKSEISLNEYSTASVINNVIGYQALVYSSVVKNNVVEYLPERDGTLYEYNMLAGDAPAGTGNVGGLVWDDQFITGETSTDGKYALSETSAAKGAGEGGTDCGIFGGNDPYILSGLPPMPFIYNVEIPSTGTGSMIMKLNARSQK